MKIQLVGRWAQMHDDAKLGKKMGVNSLLKSTSVLRASH
jgi:hypothetical protein